MPIIQPNLSNKLTVKQHIFPLAAINRFVNVNHNIHIYNVSAKKDFIIKPNAKSISGLFIAKKGWDQGTEQGYMTVIEREYQEVCEDILLSNNPITFNIQNNKYQDIITKFLTLWYFRYLYGNNPIQKQQINCISDVSYLPSQNDKIKLEKNGIISIIKKDDNFFYPSDVVTGINIQFRVMRSIDIICNWGIVKSKNDSQFIVPDCPHDDIIPFSHNLAFRMNSENSIMPLNDLRNHNNLSIKNSKKYYFANDLLKCVI